MARPPGRGGGAGPGHAARATTRRLRTADQSTGRLGPLATRSTVRSLPVVLGDPCRSTRSASARCSATSRPGSPWSRGWCRRRPVGSAAQAVGPDDRVVHVGLAGSPAGRLPARLHLRQLAGDRPERGVLRERAGRRPGGPVLALRQGGRRPLRRHRLDARRRPRAARSCPGSWPGSTARSSRSTTSATTGSWSAGSRSSTTPTPGPTRWCSSGARSAATPRPPAERPSRHAQPGGWPALASGVRPPGVPGVAKRVDRAWPAARPPSAAPAWADRAAALGRDRARRRC